MDRQADTRTDGQDHILSQADALTKNEIKIGLKIMKNQSLFFIENTFPLLLGRSSKLLE